MGSKRFQHIKTLQAAVLAGDKLAAKALEALLFVPHHLRRARGGLRLRSGYSGHADNAYPKPAFKQGLMVTAKTLQARKTIDTITISPDYGLDRLQMLKTRREARA